MSGQSGWRGRWRAISQKVEHSTVASSWIPKCRRCTSDACQGKGKGAPRKGCVGVIYSLPRVAFRNSRSGVDAVGIARDYRVVASSGKDSSALIPWRHGHECRWSRCGHGLPFTWPVPACHHFSFCCRSKVVADGSFTLDHAHAFTC